MTILQTQPGWCGPATVANLLSRLGMAGNEGELAAALGTTDEMGTTPAAIRSHLEKIGLVVEEVFGETQTGVVKRLKAGWQGLVAYQAWEVDEAELAAEEAGHYSLIESLNDGGNRVMLLDPSVKEGDELILGERFVEPGLRWLPWTEFENRWHDHDFTGKVYDRWVMWVRPTKLGV